MPVRPEEVLDVPQNLAEVKQGDQSIYALITCYYMELKHGLMGIFPVIYTDDDNDENLVMTTDKTLLLQKVAPLVTPRPFEITKVECYVNTLNWVAYSIETGLKDERVKPTTLLTEKRFDKLIAENPKPFKWAPGLVGPGMTAEEFKDTLQAALSKT